MKIAVPSTLPTIDACIGRKLSRSKYLLIIDFNTMEYEVMTNPLLLLSGPAAGKLFAMELLEENVAIVLANGCNSSISKPLGGVGIQVIIGMSGSVHRALEYFKEMCMGKTIIMPVEDVQE